MPMHNNTPVDIVVLLIYHEYTRIRCDCLPHCLHGFMTEVDNVIQKLRHFEQSPATREAGRRLVCLLQEAKREADRHPERLPLATVVTQQFSPGFEKLTAHKHLDQCAVNIERKIEFVGLWNIPMAELGFRAANCLDEIYNDAVQYLGFEKHPAFGCVKTLHR